MSDPVTLYHATSRAKLASILAEGLRPGSYWGTAEIADFSGEMTMRDFAPVP